MVKNSKKKTSSSSSKSTTADNNEEEKRKQLIQKAVHLQNTVKEAKQLSQELISRCDGLKSLTKTRRANIDADNSILEDRRLYLIHLEEKHEQALNVYKNRLKVQLTDFYNKRINKLVHSEKIMKNKKEHHYKEQELLENSKGCYDKLLKEREVAFADAKLNFIDRQYELTKDLLFESEITAYDTVQISNDNMAGIRESVEKKCKKELQLIEDRMELQLKNLLAENEENLKKVKEEYSKEVSNDLATMNSLKKNLLKAKKVEKVWSKKYDEVLADAKKIKVPLEEHKKEVNALREDLKLHEHNKKSLGAAKHKLRGLEDKLEALKWKHEVLFQKFLVLQGDNNELRLKLSDTLFKEQQNKNLPRALPACNT